MRGAVVVPFVLNAVLAALVACSGSIGALPPEEDGDDNNFVGPNGAGGRPSTPPQPGTGGSATGSESVAGGGAVQPGPAVPVVVDEIDDPALSETPNAKAVFGQNFEQVALGDPWLNSCKWKKHTQVEGSCGVNGSRCLHIKQDPFNTEPPLFPLPPETQRPPYPAGSDGQCYPYYSNTATDVVQDVVELPYGLEYSLSYDIYFQPGYDWARGGKLPGLAGKEWDSGCSIEDDGLKTDPGAHRWSVRVMWREDGASELYVYDQSRTPGNCGKRLRTKMPFVAGRWRAVTVFVKLNTSATASDGVAQLYFDGQLAQSLTGIKFRSTTDKGSLIRNIFFSTFFGGNESKRLFCKANPQNTTYCQPADPKIDTTWVPRDVAHVRFDNLAVHQGLRVRKAPGL